MKEPAPRPSTTPAVVPPVARPGPWAFWRLPSSLTLRGRFVFLVLALFTALGFVPQALDNPAATPRQLAAVLGGIGLLALSWVVAYRARRHHPVNVAIEALGIFGAGIGFDTPFRALPVLFASTFYTALFGNVVVARSTTAAYATAFLAAVALTHPPEAPSFWSAASFAPMVQLLVLGALIFSMGRAMERTEREGERASVLAALGNSLVAARGLPSVFAAGLDAAMAIAVPNGGVGVALVIVEHGAGEVVDARGTLAAARGKRLTAAELAAAMIVPAASSADLAGTEASRLSALLGHVGPVSRAVMLRNEGSGMDPWQPVVVVISAAPLPDEVRTQLGVIVHEVTLAAALERSHQALVRSERLAAIGQLAASIGHELRNPLAAIRAAATFLRRRAGIDVTDARVPELFDVIDREIVASNRIITELLDFARSRPLVLVSTDLRALVVEVAQLVPAGRAKLANEIPTSLPPQLLDRDQMRQVLSNLIQNAVEAALPEREGEVMVRAGVLSGAGLSIEIADDGPGMPPEVAARAFEPLFTTKIKGTGLGLAIVAKIIAAHRGTIRVEAREPRGTRVVIELPAEAGA